MKNKLLMMIYSLLLGSLIGTIIWLFLKITNLGIELIWNTVPDHFNIPFYTIIICLLGGIIIGLWKKRTGDYPDSLHDVTENLKKGDKYPYNNVGTISVSSMLPLLFGASVGPEAGLSNIIVGLCSWISNKFKFMYSEIKELTRIGMSATLGTIFNSPLFGFAMPIESEGIGIPKRHKIVLYFLAIFGALGAVMLLKHFFGGGINLLSFKGYVATYKEWLLLVPLSLIGVVFGIIFLSFDKLTKKISSLFGENILLKCIIAGLILGILGTLFPLAMFSGELQMEEVANTYKNIGIVTLIILAVVKLFLTNTCINLGLKGGEFFPCILAGICLGFAFGLLFNINLIFSVCILTTSLLAYVIKKPVATVLLLMICFPIAAIPAMLVASAIGGFSKK